MASSEPRNPFYFLLLAVSVLFIATALAYGIFPLMEDNAALVGPRQPISPFRAALRTNGATWLLYEVAGMAILVVMSLGLDWRRSSRSGPTNAPPSQQPPPPA
jgi:hypothetical protein